MLAIFYFNYFMSLFYNLIYSFFNISRYLYYSVQVFSKQILKIIYLISKPIFLKKVIVSSHMYLHT